MLHKNRLSTLLIIAFIMGFNTSSADEDDIFDMTTSSETEYTGDNTSFFSRIFGNNRSKKLEPTHVTNDNPPAENNAAPTGVTPHIPPVVAKPKLLLPNDPSIRIRHHSNNPTIDKNLRVSLQHNYMKEADRWYGEGAGVNTTDANGRSLLYLAIQRRHTDGIKFLLLRRANVNQNNPNGSTPLQMAVISNQPEVVEMLLERNAEIVELPSGETLIHHATKRGFEDIALLLMEKGFDINKVDGEGNTLLHLASSRGLFRMVNSLISRGANVNSSNTDGITPLHEASAKGHLAIVKTLIHHKANVNAVSRKKWTPLHHAARFGNEDIVLHLLSVGASANAINSDGSTPLALARHLNHSSIIEILTPRTKATKDRPRSTGWFW